MLFFGEPVDFRLNASDLFFKDRGSIVGVLECHLVKQYGAVEVSSMCS
jgi:hypothetical protein